MFLGMKNVAPLRIGIIGAARVAVYAMAAPASVNPRAKLAAIAARDPARAAAFAAAHGVAKVHETYDALIHDPEIDLVYVATPPALHRGIAIKALGTGKHVLVEKPFALNANEAREIVSAADRAGRRVFEAFHYRHHALWHRIVALIRGGEVGTVKTIEGVFNAPIARAPEEFRWNAALGGGALMDLGCYPLQWVRVIAGEEPVVRSARMRMVDGVDTTCEADLRFPSGIEARVSCSMASEVFTALLNVEGTAGKLRVINPLAPHFGHALEVLARGAERKEVVEGPTTFAAQLEAIAATLLDGTAFPLAPDDPIKSMAAVDAVRAAAG